MIRPSARHKKGAQVILSYILVFVAALGLVIGLVRIWMWFSANYAHREVAYQGSRLSAGKPEQYVDTGIPADYTYIDIGGADTTATPSLKYKPLNLTEEWVFQGTPSGMVGFFGGGTLTWEQMSDNCKTSCLGQPGCGDIIEDFDTNCACYVVCLCDAQTQLSLDILATQASNMRAQASSLRGSAESMRDRADECDDPWEICWWGDWGKTADELRDAADKLDQTAAELDARAADIEQTIADISACCDITDYDAQQACLDFAQDQSCSDVVGDLTNAWNNELNYLYPTRLKLERALSEITSALAACDANAALECGCQSGGVPFCYDWGWQNLGYPDYGTCYDALRNDCCRTFCCNADATSCCFDVDGDPGFCWGCGSWNRDCDVPTTDCDLDCLDFSSCTQCGLSPLKTAIEDKLNTEIIPQISLIESQIADIAGCCSFPDGDDQWDCIQDAITQSN